MQFTLILVLSLHILSTIFWAGTTIVLSRLGDAAAERLFFPQMGSAAVAFLSGGYMWSVFHGGRFAIPEQVLGAGILAALTAALLQLLLVGPKVIALRQDPTAGSALRARINRVHRACAHLLFITAISMAAAKYL